MPIPRETSYNPLDSEVWKVFFEKSRSIESYPPETQVLIRARYEFSGTEFETHLKPPEILMPRTLELLG